jgi:Spy/CpxP family protein refolding chaperone
MEMKRTKLVTLTLLALTFAISSGVALAQEQATAPPGPKLPILKCLAIVDLTADQKTQIKAIVETTLPKLQALGQTVQADRLALKTALEATPQDNCAIGAALVKLTTDEKAVGTELQNLRKAIIALLTPEQKAKLDGCLEAPKD